MSSETNALVSKHSGSGDVTLFCIIQCAATAYFRILQATISFVGRPPFDITYLCNYIDTSTLEDEDTTLPRNIGIRLPFDTASFPGRTESLVFHENNDRIAMCNILCMGKQGLKVVWTGLKKLVSFKESYSKARRKVLCNVLYCLRSVYLKSYVN